MQFNGAEFGRCGALCSFCPFFKEKGFLRNAANLVLKNARLSDEATQTLRIIGPLECPGCDNSIFGDCPVKTCCRDKGFNFCWECDRFPCDKLKNAWRNHPNHLESLVDYLNHRVGLQDLVIISPPSPGSFKESLGYILTVIKETHMERWIERVTSEKVSPEQVTRLVRELELLD